MHGPRPLNLLVAGSLGAAACLAAVAVIGSQDSGVGSAQIAIAPTGAIEITPLGDLAEAASSADAIATVPVGTAPAVTTVSTTSPAAGSAGDEPTVVNARVAAAAELHVVGVWVASEFVSTGVLIDGYVLTSANAIGDQLSVAISSDGDSTLAYLVGTDPFSDLAVYRPSIDSRRPDALVAISLRMLQVNPSKETPDWTFPADAPLAESPPASQPPIVAGGDTVVLATATPDGFRTRDGLVLATGQDAETSDGRPLVGLIDTTLRRTSQAAGGLLVTTNGTPVGIVIESSSSLASAVPIDDARRIAEHLVEDGWASQTWIGFMGIDLDRGVEVIDVSIGGPADVAGLAPGDVIAFFDGAPVKDMGGVTAGLRRAEPGDTVVLVIERDGAFIALRVVVEDYMAPKVNEPVDG